VQPARVPYRFGLVSPQIPIFEGMGVGLEALQRVLRAFLGGCNVWLDVLAVRAEPLPLWQRRDGGRKAEHVTAAIAVITQHDLVLLRWQPSPSGAVKWKEGTAFLAYAVTMAGLHSVVLSKA
jgi:hypothetical protein